MSLVDILHLLFSVQTPIGGDIGECVECPGSVVTAVAAAWATQGYWVHADLLWYLENTGFGYYAPLVYVIAAGAGLISMAINMPQRMYMWYFIGPVLYNVLLFTHQPAGGVQWQIGFQDDGSPSLADQNEVWKLAEVGLVNTNIRNRVNLTVSAKDNPGGGDNGDGTVNVSTFFLWWDSLTSDFVQSLVSWIGFMRQNDNNGASQTNIAEGTGFADSKWYLLSNVKWPMLENVTAATLSDPSSLDVFATFQASECGDILISHIDQAQYLTSAKSKSGKLPATIFKEATYQKLTEELARQTVPTPPSFRRLLGSPILGELGKQSSLSDFNGIAQQYAAGSGITDTIQCDNFFYMMFQIVRWEAGNTYYQLIDSAPAGTTEEEVVQNFFYGWSVKRNAADPNVISVEDGKEVLKDLILIHTLRNAMVYTPNLVETRYAPSEKREIDIQAFQRTLASKTKFGEVYTWALLVPYIQGIVLYFLAIAYPFACVAVIIPGMHKMILQWMKYWLWIKIWDVGFALVMVLERGVWAMIGNSSMANKLFPSVVEMSNIGRIRIECPGDIRAADCVVPRIIDNPVVGTPMGDGTIGWFDTVRLYDRALALGANMDLDLANSYYIYIMAALYFGVPAVSGMLVGGAASIASGSLDKMTDAKSAAGTGYTAEVNHKTSAAQAATNQESQFKAARGNGSSFGSSAMGTGSSGANQAAQGGRAGNAAGNAAGNGTGNASSQAVGSGTGGANMGAPAAPKPTQAVLPSAPIAPAAPLKVTANGNGGGGGLAASMSQQAMGFGGAGAGSAAAPGARGNAAAGGSDPATLAQAQGRPAQNPNSASIKAAEAGGGVTPGPSGTAVAMQTPGGRAGAAGGTAANGGGTVANGTNGAVAMATQAGSNPGASASGGAARNGSVTALGSNTSVASTMGSNTSSAGPAASVTSARGTNTSVASSSVSAGIYGNGSAGANGTGSSGVNGVGGAGARGNPGAPATYAARSFDQGRYEQTGGMSGSGQPTGFAKAASQMPSGSGMPAVASSAPRMPAAKGGSANILKGVV